MSEEDLYERKLEKARDSGNIDDAFEIGYELGLSELAQAIATQRAELAEAVRGIPIGSSDAFVLSCLRAVISEVLSIIERGKG